MPLNVTQRPQTFEEFAGNDATVESLISVLSRPNDIPRSYFFTGPPGTGKTTVARIIKNHLKILDMDFFEYNAANTRGIDTIRSIASNAALSAHGERKMYLLDECFAKGTRVKTVDGEREIEKISIGDMVHTSCGIKPVTYLYTIEVPTERVCRVRLFAGTNIVCSIDHLFFTNKGWITAKNLKGLFTTPYSLQSSTPRRKRERPTEGQEGQLSQANRVESVQIYKRGSNEEYFKGVIDDRERDRGYVELYDLEVRDAHNYFANGVLVHNCHQITGPAMEALLKLLEEPPKHVIIALCTSEPQSIPSNTLEAVKRRCFKAEFKLLPSPVMIPYLKFILEKEQIKDFPQTVLTKIVKHAAGSPGHALSLLDSVIDMSSEESMLAAIEAVVVSEASILELINSLLDVKMSASQRWDKCRKLLGKIDKNPESVRRAIMEYLSRYILNRGSMREVKVALYFTDSFFNSGRLGLVCACYLACQEK